MVANTKNPIHNFNININGTYTSTQKVLPCDTYDITLMAADQQGNFSGVTPIIHFTLGVLAGDTPAQSTIESIPGGDDDPIVNSLLPPICVRAPDGT